MKNRFESAVFMLLAVSLLIATSVYSFMFTPPDKEDAVKNIFIEQGASFRLIAKDLEKHGIITSAHKFSILAKFKGALKKVKSGEYEFTTSMLPAAVLDKLVRGQAKEYSVTIPEGYNVMEIAETLDEQGLANKEEFTKKANDKEVIASLNIEGTSINGYLFPDTYRLTKGMTAMDIIKKMVMRFDEVYEEIRVKGQGGYPSARMGGVKMTKKEIVILASIIEKETGAADERHLISAVFHNRLKRGMKLESDPTVIYGIKNFNGNITRKDLETITPYNTYKIYGLPPGPISNPGRASIEAAMNPKDEGYIFFVSRNDGSHHFSKDINEHNKAVEIYQKRKADFKNG